MHVSYAFTEVEIVRTAYSILFQH